MKAEVSAKLCWFYKKHSSQHSLLCLLEVWKVLLDNWEYVRALFISPKSLRQKIYLLLANLTAYDFVHKSSNVMLSFLNNVFKEVILLVQGRKL